ncbi:hypothetical protein [Desulfosarcina sp.]|uniref:hypothetical protein n=1 Tax=Desulfosarcina sp. TaxID=2027861 RepID=UPI0039705BB9
MEINNLEINILYFMCNPINGQAEDGTIDSRDVFEQFSDIPAGSIMSAINSMVKNRLITTDPSRSRLWITAEGINRLQSSIACRIHQFDSCRCEHATGRKSQE